MSSVSYCLQTGSIQRYGDPITGVVPQQEQQHRLLPIRCQTKVSLDRVVVSLDIHGVPSVSDAA